MGVTRLGNRRFRARYSLHGKRYNVGTFKTKKEAHSALGEHYWNNPELMRGYQDHSGSTISIGEDHGKRAGDKIVLKKPLKERVKAKWQSVRESLEKRNLL